MILGERHPILQVRKARLRMVNDRFKLMQLTHSRACDFTSGAGLQSMHSFPANKLDTRFLSLLQQITTGNMYHPTVL